MKTLGLVFDLDDTLYLERDYVASGLRAVDRWLGSNLGWTGFYAHAWRQYVAGTRGTIFDRALSEMGMNFDAGLIETLVDVYRSHRPAIALAPDAAECLRALAGKVKLALITDGCRASQERKVGALQLESLFDPIVLTDVWGAEYWKPHPRAFAHVQAHFGLDPAQLMYVGDNPSKDFHAPVRLGWRTVRIRRPDGSHAGACNDPQYSPDMQIADLGCLPEMMVSL